MSAYRKKPVVIEARQLTPGRDEAYALAQWCGGHLDENEVYQKPSIIIPTLEGDHRADPGDWIIKGIAGEFYPCKPEIFEATYEPADAADPAAAERERIAKLADDLKAHYSPSDDGDPSFSFADLIRGQQ